MLFLMEKGGGVMGKFDFNTEAVKVALSYGAAFFAAHFAGSEKHIAVLIFFILADTFIGWLVYIKLGEWQSSKARWGFVGKIAELVLVAMLYMLDWLFEVNCLEYLGIYYFIICEGASIIENIAKINHNIPKGLAELLQSVQKSAGTELVKCLRKIINKED